VENDTIAGIASGMGGGIGIIRISGEKAFSIVGDIFRTKKYLSADKDSREKWDQNFFWKKKSHTFHYGVIIDDSYNVLDEVMVLLMYAPKSYTCEHVAEIDCHGGPYVIKKILQLLLHHGARLAEPGEFTKRAFLNGRIDLSQAEAVMKMISSKNEFALNSAVRQLEGRVSNYIEEIRQEILYHMSYIESALDDPEHYELGGYSEELCQFIKEEIRKLQNLLDNFENGRMKEEGIRTVIVGKPNAGKSSLMNLLLDEDRAIVTNVAGTTRDILEETVQIGNIILHLVDTAGIHETEDFVESLGIEKAMESVDSADFIIYVVDSSTSFDEADEKIISLLHGKNGVVLLNKSDLENPVKEAEVRKRINWDCLIFSSKTGDGLKNLENYIMNSFLGGKISFNDQIYLTSLRHREAVESALESLGQVVQTIENGMPEDFYTVDLMEAYQKLGLINGETASEDLINKIFQEFCMGK